MTENRARKQATRTRMAATGENYLTAVRNGERDTTPFQAVLPGEIDPEAATVEELLDLPWDANGQFTDGETPDDNTRRAGFALTALAAFQDQVGGDDALTTISDLLCDLMHLADALGVTFDGLVDSGSYHYRAEIRGEL